MKSSIQVHAHHKRQVGVEVGGWGGGRMARSEKHAQIPQMKKKKKKMKKSGKKSEKKKKKEKKSQLVCFK